MMLAVVLRTTSYLGRETRAEFCLSFRARKVTRRQPNYLTDEQPNELARVQKPVTIICWVRPTAAPAGQEVGDDQHSEDPVRHGLFFLLQPGLFPCRHPGR